MSIRRAVYFLISVIILASCDDIIPSGPAASEILDGPVDGLTAAENARFLRGDIAFNDEIFTTTNGLGPLFVATSCGSCHPGDGKGHPFTTLTRFGQSDDTGNKFLDQGGPQLQNRAIPGHAPEFIPLGATSSKFTPPANTGLGFLAALTDEQILSHADPHDADGDGISGVPNYINAPEYFRQEWIHQEHNGRYIGRFGKKAAAVDLMHQTVNAYNQDIGITSTYNSLDPMTGDYADPEVSDNTVLDVVFYLRTLKAPIQRDADNAEVIAGKAIFNTVGCNKCHTPEWKTPKSDIAALSEKTFHPYTDLLLHDMGPGLDDKYTEGSAKTFEWRTPPLWGLGLSGNSQGGGYYLLHDGRATSINEAIMLHGGEAAQSQEKFSQLGTTEKASLIRFLESL
ncbi:MAG TPA: di-heme oxidoredictase family protein [Cyclobacteriaceae bacterium]|nr:di-heme oxidoredictase family protein [Cyclobacteriaceae bacterium]